MANFGFKCEMDPNESRLWNVKSIKWKSAGKRVKIKEEKLIGNGEGAVRRGSDKEREREGKQR